MTNDKMPRMLLTVVTLLSTAAIIGGIAVTGGPFHQRELRMDEIRSNDLIQIKGYMTQYYSHNKTLPVSLDVLKEDLKSRLEITSNAQVFQDPVTEAPYQYRLLSPEQFSLCANFEVDTRKDTGTHSRFYYTAPDAATEQHAKGPVCYTVRKSTSQTLEFEWFKKP